MGTGPPCLVVANFADVSRDADGMAVMQSQAARRRTRQLRLSAMVPVDPPHPHQTDCHGPAHVAYASGVQQLSATATIADRV